MSAHKSPSNGRGWIRRLFWSRGIGLAAVLVVGIAVLVTGVAIWAGITGQLAPGTPHAANASNAAAVSSSSVPATADAGACDVAIGDRSTNPATPKDLRWLAHDGFTWPESATVGPTQQTPAGLGVCFAHSPIGAVMAAAVIGTSVEQGHGLHAVDAQYATDSAGRRAILAAPEPTQSALPNGMTLAGYQVESYTSAEAKVLLVLTAPGTTTGFAGASIDLVWSGNDWKMRLLDDGSPSSGVAFVADGEFTKWVNR